MPRQPQKEAAPYPAQNHRGIPAAQRPDSPDPLAPDREHGLEDLDLTRPAPIDVGHRQSDPPRPPDK